MRWKKNPEPEFEDERIVTGFLWFPKTKGGITRWLERATWRQRFLGPFGWVDFIGGKWLDIETVGKKEADQ